MAKGNYTALQQLKPTEIKVGELYSNWVDGYVKNGEAERAAKAKLLADQKKSAQEMVAKIDPKIFTTLQSFQPQTNAIFNQILENKALLGRMADSGQLDSNFYNLKAKTDNLASQYIQLSTFLTNPQFLEADKKINEQIQEGDVFEGDENMGRWMSIKSGMAQLKANPNTGNIEVVYNDNVKSTDTERPAKVEQIHEFASNYTAGLSKDLSAEIQEKLKAVGTAASTSTNVNKDGITTVTRKAFDTKAATNTITQLMGLDPNRPVEEQFTNVNNLTPFAKQYFYKNGRLRFPQNGEDLKELVNDAVNFAKGYADTAYGSITSQSADEIIGKKLDNQLKRKALTEPPTTSTPTVSIYDGGIITRKVNDGSAEYDNATIINLKNREYIVGFKVPNQSGKGFHQEYFIAGKDEKGRLAIDKPTTKLDVSSRIQGYGYNPTEFENRIKSSPATSIRNYQKKNNLGTIKYDEAFRPESQNIDPLMQYFLNGGGASQQ